MNVKYLMIVSLVLAILTIGAVSASDDADNLTVSDEGVDLQEAPLDDVELTEDSDNEILSDSPSAESFEVEVNYSPVTPYSDDYAIMVSSEWGYYTGNISVAVDNKDPILFEIGEYTGNPDEYEPFWDKKITLEDLNIASIGTYSLNVKFITDSGKTIDLGKHTLNVVDEEKFTASDFDSNYGIEKLIAVNSDEDVVSINNYYANGNLTAKINGVQVASKKFNEGYAGFDLNDLKINSEGNYTIQVGYTHPTGKYSINLIEGTFKVIESEGYPGFSAYINNVDYGETFGDDDDMEPEWLECICYCGMNDVNLEGNVLVFIDNELYYNKTMEFENYIHLNDLNKKPSIGEHVVQIKFEDEYGEVTTVKTRLITIGNATDKTPTITPAPVTPIATPAAPVSVPASVPPC
ncbi:MAG: hypothetical protein Q4Q18_00300 [Methanobrevibacter sp.]|nr:hypothetical protein [Methanobrevibacter sp.]